MTHWQKLEDHTENSDADGQVLRGAWGLARSEKAWAEHFFQFPRPQGVGVGGGREGGLHSKGVEGSQSPGSLQKLKVRPALEARKYT